jgi:hypothetical protein
VPTRAAKALDDDARRDERRADQDQVIACSTGSF